MKISRLPFRASRPKFSTYSFSYTGWQRREGNMNGNEEEEKEKAVLRVEWL